MSRSQTVELLNETDELERKLSWQLFKLENEKVVYGEGTEWQPGDALFDRWAVDYGHSDIRPLVQIIDRPSLSGYLASVQYTGFCHLCQVSWFSEDLDEVCWSCGTLEYTHAPFRPKRVIKSRAITNPSRSSSHVTFYLDEYEWSPQMRYLADSLVLTGRSASQFSDQLAYLQEALHTSQVIPPPNEFRRLLGIDFDGDTLPRYNTEDVRLTRAMTQTMFFDRWVPSHEPPTNVYNKTEPLVVKLGELSEVVGIWEPPKRPRSWDTEMVKVQLHTERIWAEDVAKPFFEAEIKPIKVELTKAQSLLENKGYRAPTIASQRRRRDL